MIIGNKLWKEILYKNKTPCVCVCPINTTIRYNGKLVMGAGIAKLFNNAFPGLDTIFGSQISQLFNGSKTIEESHRERLRRIPIYAFYGRGRFFIYGLITKTDWKEKSDEYLVLDSVRDMDRYIVSYHGNKPVYMPKPGCGLGGLDWNKLKEKLNFLDDRYIIL